MMMSDLESRDRLGQEQKRKKEIRESTYNARYEKIIVETYQKCLGRKSKREVRMLARFRWGM